MRWQDKVVTCFAEWLTLTIGGLTLLAVVLLVGEAVYKLVASMVG